MKKRYTEEQIIGFLKEADRGMPVKELCRKHGFSEPSYYALAQQVRRHGCVGRPTAQVAGGGERAAEEAAGRHDAGERARQGSPPKKMVTAPARRELVRWLTTKGLSERRSLAMASMSASALRYRAAARSQRGPSGEHRGIGSAASTVRGRHDLPQAQAVWRPGELQADRAAVPA